MQEAIIGLVLAFWSKFRQYGRKEKNQTKSRLLLITQAVYMQNEPLMSPTLIESTLVFDESFVKVKRDRLQINGRPPYDYYSLLAPPFAVAILAITPEGSYVLIEEYRHPTGRVLLGCPAGYIDPGEDAIQAAKRELLEETGYQANSFTVIGSAFPYTGFSGQKTIYVKATEATFAAPPHHEVSELISTRLLMPEALVLAIDAGEALDGTLCTALFFHQLHR
jgi:ADP-ribose pyrophosphatase